MKGSLRTFRLAGIDLRVHFTFPLILLWGALHWGATYGSRGALYGAVLTAALFACVLLHELGHALAARRLGIPVREIVLLPIGGVAQLERNPCRPLHELLIAAAGPLVNVVIALLLAAFLWWHGELPATAGTVAADVSAPSLRGGLYWLLGSNVLLVLFNLVPAFPMDGGRMLRAVLAMAMGYPQATRIAAALGQGIAVVAGIWAIFRGDFMLAIVALFVFLGATGERASEEARGLLSTLRLRDAYNKHALVLAPGDPVSRVVDYLLTSYQPDFAVVLGGHLLGVVTRDAALRALVAEDGDVYVAGIMDRQFLRLEAALTLAEARETLLERGTTVGAVFDGERFLGLVNESDLAEALQIAAFLKLAEVRQGRPLRAA
jgi:Zn-dependent protease